MRCCCYRRLYDSPRYKDEEEERRQLEARQKKIQHYRMFRERVERWREEDRLERNKNKIQQLEECERLQVINFLLIVNTHMPFFNLPPTVSFYTSSHSWSQARVLTYRTKRQLTYNQLRRCQAVVARR